MGDRDLATRIQRAFSEPDKVKADEYQQLIEVNATKAAENVERLTFTLLGLATLLILVAQGQIKKLDLGFMEIDNPSIILISTPILVAYVHYDLIATLSKFDLLSIIHKAIIKQRHPPIHVNGLTKYFLFLPTLYENKYHSSEGMLGSLEAVLWLLEFVFIAGLTPIGSEWIAFSELRTLAIPENNSLLWVSIGITFILNFQSVLTIIIMFQRGNVERGDRR